MGANVDVVDVHDVDAFFVFLIIIAEEEDARRRDLDDRVAVEHAVEDERPALAAHRDVLAAPYYGARHVALGLGSAAADARKVSICADGPRSPELALSCAYTYTYTGVGNGVGIG